MRVVNARAPAYGLTRKQGALLAYLRACEWCPSFLEMQAHLGLASKSGVHRLLTALEERGAIRRLHGHARAIEVLDRTSEITVTKRAAVTVSHPDVIELPVYTRLQLNWRPEVLRT